MPLVVAYLAEFPTPLGGAEDVGIALGEVASQEQNQSAVPYEQGVMMPIHLCN